MIHVQIVIAWLSKMKVVYMQFSTYFLGFLSNREN